MIGELSVTAALRAAQTECVTALALVEAGYVGWTAEPLQRAQDLLDVAERLLREQDGTAPLRRVETAAGTLLREVLG